MRFRWWQPFMFLEEDDGAGGGGGGPEEPAPDETPDGGGGNDDTEEKMPTYFGQFPKEKMQSEAYKALYRYQKLDELADAFIQVQSELEGIKAGQKNMLAVPGKDATQEEKDAFAEKLGIPKDASGYEMKMLDGALAPEIIEAVKKGCRASGFTKGQGEAFGAMLINVDKAAATKAEINLRNSLKTREERTAASYKDIASEVDRKEQAKKDINLFDGFLRDIGLSEKLSHSAFAADPEVIKAVAAYARKTGGTVTPKGMAGPAGGRPKEDTYMGQPYSKDFQELIDSRR